MSAPHLNASPHCFQLNAFDSRHLDEIYFDVRLTAFQDATRRVSEMRTLDLDYISTLLHNCFHTYEVGGSAVRPSDFAERLQSSPAHPLSPLNTAAR